MVANIILAPMPIEGSICASSKWNNKPAYQLAFLIFIQQCDFTRAARPVDNQNPLGKDIFLCLL
jgi:hypothetical protein